MTLLHDCDRTTVSSTVKPGASPNQDAAADDRSSITVLHVIESLGRGGAEQALVNLLPSLSNCGIKSAVATLRDPHALAATVEQLGVSVVRVPVMRRWSLLKGSRVIESLAQQVGADIVHAHLYFSGLYTALGKRLTKTRRRVITFHNLAYAADVERGRLKSLLRKQVNRLALAYGIDHFSAVSSAAAEHYRHHLRLAEVDVIPNGIPVSRIQEQIPVDRAPARAELRVPADEPLLICPGRLVPEKGHADLLEACALLQQQQVGYQLRIVGDGPLEQAIRARIVELGLQERVQLLPAVPQQRLIEWVAASDCFVLASRHEGFGLAPAEAMAIGTPVIATQVGGLVDVVDSGINGLLVPGTNPAALADAIARVLADKALRARFSAAGKTKVEQQFDVTRIALRWRTVYDRLLAADNTGKSWPRERN